jgi:hypothetical protein
LGLALALGVSSCGSSGDGGSCGKVQPCGGDPTGTWDITLACLDSAIVASSFQDPQCPTATASLGQFTTTGVASFNADKSYSVTEMVSISLNVVLPPSCLAAIDTTATCAQVAQAILDADAASASPSFSTVSCVAVNGCRCSLAFAPMTMTDAGTWSTSGTNIDLMSTTSGNSSPPYCVAGNEIHVITLDMTMPMGPMGTVKIAGDLVATKRAGS